MCVDALIHTRIMPEKKNAHSHPIALSHQHTHTHLNFAVRKAFPASQMTFTRNKYQTTPAEKIKHQQQERQKS